MERLKSLQNTALVIAMVIVLQSCSSSKSYQAKYEEAWEEVVQSDEWKSSISEEPDEDFLANGSDDNEQWIGNNDYSVSVKDPFEEKYDRWVAGAYHKIIAEAEAADNEIKAEYDRFIAENPEANTSTDENVVKILELYKKKYAAHRSMLEGLKSWNAYETYGSDDIKFFKEENRQVVSGMYRNGRQEDDIVDFLVYKLADLYHLEEND